MLSHPSSLAARQRRSPEMSSKAPASARGRTRIGVLKPVERRDSTSCLCFSSSKRVRYWNGEGRIATIGIDRSAAWSLILSPRVCVTASAPAVRADQNRARGGPENSRRERFSLQPPRACLLRVTGTDRANRFRLANCCSIDLCQLSRNKPMHASETGVLHRDNSEERQEDQYDAYSGDVADQRSEQGGRRDVERNVDDASREVHLRPNGAHPSISTRDLHQQYRRSEQRKGLQEVAKRSLEPARDPRERWPCLSRRGCPPITHLQARRVSTKENLNEPEDDAQGQHFQLE